MFLRKPSAAWKVGSQDAPPGSLHPGPASPFPPQNAKYFQLLESCFSTLPRDFCLPLAPFQDLCIIPQTGAQNRVQERTRPQLEWLSSLLHGPGKAPSVDLSPCHWVKKEHGTLSTGLLAASPRNQAFGDCLGVPHQRGLMTQIPGSLCLLGFRMDAFTLSLSLCAACHSHQSLTAPGEELPLS